MSRKTGAIVRTPPDIYYDEQVPDKRNLIVAGPDERIFIQHSVFNKDALYQRWPESTDIACFHDTEPFEGTPVFLPETYHPTQGVYEGFGVFCSPACAKAFLVDRPSYKKSQVMLHMNAMLREIFGITDPIVQAPSRFSLKKFGGPYSIDEFRNKSKSIRVLTHTPPIITHAMVFEERPVDSKTGRDKYPDSAAPVSTLSAVTGGRWSVRGLKIPKKTTKGSGASGSLQDITTVTVSSGSVNTDSMNTETVTHPETVSAEAKEVTEVPSPPKLPPSDIATMQQYSTKSLYSEFLEEARTRLDTVTIGGEFSPDVPPVIETELQMSIGGPITGGALVSASALASSGPIVSKQRGRKKQKLETHSSVTTSKGSAVKSSLAAFMKKKT